MQIGKKFSLLFILLSGLLLAACNDMQQSKPTKPVAEKYTSNTVLLTGKAQGTSEIVEAVDETQNVIVSAQVQEKGRYQLEIPAQTKLPIILRADEFISVVVDADVTNYDINALTTNIASRAKSLGGYTRHNMVLAASDSVHTPDANKTSTGWRGDTTSQYGGWH